MNKTPGPQVVAPGSRGEYDGLVLDGNVESREDLNCRRITTITDDDPADDILEIRVEVLWNEPTLGRDQWVQEEVYTLLSESGGA